MRKYLINEAQQFLIFGNMVIPYLTFLTLYQGDHSCIKLEIPIFELAGRIKMKQAHGIKIF